MNLFDMVEQNLQTLPTQVREGTRLQRVELYNWGTFHNKIWTLSVDGDTALLTGDVGSGKSSVVDAVTTLLVPPQKTVYNKAADASAKERSVTSYFLGYYGQEEGYEGKGKPLALRTKSSYCVLLAEFHNEFTDNTTTLAQLLYYTANENQSTPRRIYVLYEGSLSIAGDFAQFSGDAREIKGRLRQKGCATYDEFTSYSLAYRKKLGNLNEQAINLFSQTISMKTVDKLNPFIRSNMLQKEEGIEDSIRHLIDHYQSLTDAYQRVCDVKKQVELLLPMEEQGQLYQQAQTSVQLYEVATEQLPCWVAQEKAPLFEVLIGKSQRSLDEQQTQLPREQSILAQIEQDIRQLQREIDVNGGGRLAQLKENDTTLAHTKQSRQELLGQYQKNSTFVNLPTPKSHGTFLKNRELIESQLTTLTNAQGQWHTDLQEIRQQTHQLQQEQQEGNQELNSLRGRSSNIDRKYVDLRTALCKDLHLKPELLPFAGELMEVRESESPWEGALERLLHSFALSMLVPKEQYKAVATWMDANQLHLKLVYYAVDTKKSLPSAPQLHPSSAVKKLFIKEGTPYRSWMFHQLCHRADHICCETMEDFTRYPKAITLAGQMKSGPRNEKDDRRGLHDRNFYVLGFSNQKKIALLEEKLSALQKAHKALTTQQTTLEQQIKEGGQKRDALIRLQHYQSFELLDVASVTQQIKDVQAEIHQIETGNDLLNTLTLRLEGLIDQKTAQDAVLRKLDTSIELTRRELIDYQQRAKENENQATGQVFPQVATLLHRLCYVQTVNTLNQWEAKASKLRTQLTEQLRTASKQEGDSKTKILRQMDEFRRTFPNESVELDASIAALKDFLRLLEQYQKNDLPRHEEKFKQDLQRNLIKNIGLFHQRINESSQQIRHKIDQINQSLREIHFNRGSYIAVGCQETRDVEIVEFRHNLRQCTEGSAQGFRDVAVAEAKFLQIKAIIDRLKGREGFADLDKRWRQKVTDIRNWHDFSASERNQETEEQIEYYTDSGGKSGGQKEKLAYTILAAGLAYNFNLTHKSLRPESFRFVIIDEAFLKSSDESTRFGLELFRTLGFQLLIVTPLLKITTIEPYISSVGLVQQNKETHQSAMQSISIEEYQRRRKEQS